MASSFVSAPSSLVCSRSRVNLPRNRMHVACKAQSSDAPMVRKLALPVGVGSALLAAAPGAHAAVQQVAEIAEVSSLGVAVVGAGAIAGLAALLVADPEKRRTQMASEAGGDEMESVKNYFNTTGYDRWKRIYGETDDVNKVQLDIRNGHAQTVDKVLRWLKEEGNLQNCTVADCGCGTGSLAVPLALEGAAVSASDISAAMVGEAEARFTKELAAGAAAPAVMPKFDALDLESVSGKYNTVTCLDVMIHYPQDKADAMVGHLASLAEDRLIISFAPYTFSLALLKRIGELFPGPSKATRAYLHAESDVEASLKAAGFEVVKREMTSTQFYFSRLLEAKRVSA